MALFLEIVTLSYSSMVFLLATVHVDALSGAQSRFAVVGLLFVAVSDDMFLFRAWGF